MRFDMFSNLEYDVESSLINSADLPTCSLPTFLIVTDSKLLITKLLIKLTRSGDFSYIIF